MDDDLLGELASRLRAADTFAAAAAATIDLLGRWPGVTAVAVEAHDRHGPSAWFASSGYRPPAGYLDGGRLDPWLARARPIVQPWTDRAEWACAIIGCGEVLGAVRLRVAPGAEVARLLAQACTLISVRAAQLGGTCEDELGAAALTARQYEVSVLVARGSTNAEIARLLAISPDAVKKHVSRALVALAVSNRTELASIAGRWRCSAKPAPAPALHVERRPKGLRSFAVRARAA